MSKEIVTFRDSNAAVLFKKTEKVEKFDRSLAVLADKMGEIMEKADGLGLAAPQVNSKLAVCLVKNGKKIVVFCNPKILDYSSEKDIMEEGCLSFPDIFLQVPRARSISIEYKDLKGKKKKIEAEGIFARAIQHEVDHLSGIVFTNRAGNKLIF